MAEKKKSSARNNAPTNARQGPLSDTEILAILNQAESEKELIEAAGLSEEQAPGARALLAHRSSLKRSAFTSVSQLHKFVALDPASAAIIDAIRGIALPEPEEIPVERRNFTQLLVQNPNYFGNLLESPFDPVLPIQGNTNFESLECVGMNPPFDRLEAVIQVKNDSGYGGDICSTGSREFVRFYVDVDDNGTWEDVGFSQVRVYDIPGPKPLCYAVSHTFDPLLKLCFIENIVKVRAILSWNAVPPANQPNFVPVWGERKDVEVQIRPRKFILIDDFVDLIPKDDPLVPVLHELQVDKLAGIEPKPALTLAAKKELYRADEVPVGRFAFTEALALTKTAGQNAFASPTTNGLQQLGLEAQEIEELIKGLQILPVDGNTDFEEMTCIGYDPGKKLLQAVIHVKRSSGFSGSLCTEGSTEYVAFWANFGAGYQYLGTATVQVHDLQTLPRGGVHYAVDLKVDLSDYEIPCTSGARTPRLRAIMSWQNPPPPANPFWVPTWGNREDCRIQLCPGPAISHVPLIETVGDIAVSDVDQFTGLATGPFVIGGGMADLSPFGAKVTLTGRIGAPPDSFGGAQQPFKYRVRVSDDGGFTWETLNNNVLVNVSEWLNGMPQQCAPGDFVCSKTLSTTDDGDGLGGGWYTYLEDTILPWTRALVVDKLAEWHTGAREGLWRIELAAKDGDGNILGYDYTNVLLDNYAPSVGPPAADSADPLDPPALRLAITHYVLAGDSKPAVECDQIPVGAVIHGTYQVADPGVTHAGQHLHHMSLGVIPHGPAGGASVELLPTGALVSVGNTRYFPALPTFGEDGTWELDTTPMKACGYVLRLTAVDRTIVNSAHIGWHRHLDVGFCLV